MANDCTDIVVSEANMHADVHIVEIPADVQDNIISSSPAKPPQHPLEEIADSRGHLLLLKLWQREEEAVARHIESKESRIESIRTEVFQFSCLFFAFHGILLTLLFTASTQENAHTCTRWWVPAALSFVASLVLTCTIQYKLIVQGKVVKMVQDDKAYLRALIRCIQELRMKGMSFDLSKEPHPSKRWKSSSVEYKLSPVRWCSQCFYPIALAVISSLVLWSCKLIACS